MAARKQPKCSPAVWHPWPVVVLNIDTAKKSGWAITVHSVLVDAGVVIITTTKFQSLVDICVRAQTLAKENDCACVLVLEKPPPFVYGGHGAQVMVGLGSARKAWEMAWNMAGGIMARIARIEPEPWRKAVLGKSRRSKNEPEDMIAQLERMRAKQLLAEAGLPVEQRSDAYTAVCISFYAARCGEVGDVLPKKLREKHVLVQKKTSLAKAAR